VSDQQAMQDYVRQQAANLAPVGPANYNPVVPTQYDVQPILTADVGGEKSAPVFSDTEQALARLWRARENAKALWLKMGSANQSPELSSILGSQYVAADSEWTQGLANPAINPMLARENRWGAQIGPAIQDASVIQDAIDTRQQRGRRP
jgi:hypothetical protein